MSLARILPLFLLALVLPARADRVILTNGQSLEGRITVETPTSVSLKVAGGSVSLPRSTITSVVRGSAKDNAALEEAWLGRRFLDRAHVPAGFEELAERCRSLDALRARAGIGTDLQAVWAYKGGIDACSQMLASAETAWTGDPAAEGAVFMRRVRARLEGARGEFSQSNLTPEKKGNAFLLPVLINGRTQGRFILDTGAEITTLSRTIAEKAGLTATGRVTTVGMADGTRFEAPVVTLPSLRLGSFERKNVDAVLLPNPPDDDVDGLLGMNVLGTFILNFDPRTGQLQLEQLKQSGLR